MYVLRGGISIYIQPNFLTITLTVGVNSRNVQSGVPQGSLLSPTLLLFYINDVAVVKLNGDLRIYTDDSCVTYYGIDIDSIITSVLLDITEIQRWLNCSQLSFNVGKSKAMIFPSLDLLFI